MDSPLAQAKSLANHGQEITKETREINKLEKKMKNSLKKMEFLLAIQGLRLLPKKEKKNTLLRAQKEGINPVHRG